MKRIKIFVVSLLSIIETFIQFTRIKVLTAVTDTYCMISAFTGNGMNLITGKRTEAIKTACLNMNTIISAFRGNTLAFKRTREGMKFDFFRDS